MAGNVKEVTDATFEQDVLKSDLPVLVDYWAIWCGPCKALAPVIEELSNDNEGKINVYKMDVDANPDTAAKYGIRGIPTVIFFKNGEIVDQVVGNQSKADFQSRIDQL